MSCCSCRTNLCDGLCRNSCTSCRGRRCTCPGCDQCCRRLCFCCVCTSDIVIKIGWIICNVLVIIGGIAMISYSANRGFTAVSLVIDGYEKAGIAFGSFMVALGLFGIVVVFFEKAYFLTGYCILSILVWLPLLFLSGIAVTYYEKWLPNINDYPEIYIWMRKGWTNGVRYQPNNVCKYMFNSQCSGWQTLCTPCVPGGVGCTPALSSECPADCKANNVFGVTCYNTFVNDLSQFSRTWGAIGLSFVLFMIFGTLAAFITSICSSSRLLGGFRLRPKQVTPEDPSSKPLLGPSSSTTQTNLQAPSVVVMATSPSHESDLNTALKGHHTYHAIPAHPAINTPSSTPPPQKVPFDSSSQQHRDANEVDDSQMRNRTRTLTTTTHGGEEKQSRTSSEHGNLHDDKNDYHHEGSHPYHHHQQQHQQQEHHDSEEGGVSPNSHASALRGVRLKPLSK
mmetsp:Transcript_33196/g.53821  ORF Transcript_33196/g.53821 Transcript_33196/m.53821 type:complete len:452 (+) Transcript_33196:37-1392(+)